MFQMDGSHDSHDDQVDAWSQMHELAAGAADGPGADVVFLQERKVDALIMVRCPMCQGLRPVPRRHVTRNGEVCKDCRSGRVITRTQFHNYWTKRFSTDEIEEMAKAIWG